MLRFPDDLPVISWSVAKWPKEGGDELYVFHSHRRGELGTWCPYEESLQVFHCPDCGLVLTRTEAEAKLPKEG